MIENLLLQIEFKQKKEKRKKRATCFATLRKLLFLDFHSTKQGLPLVDSWSRNLD